MATSVEGQLCYEQLLLRVYWALLLMIIADGAKHHLALVRWYEEVTTQATSASLSNHLAFEDLSTSD